MHFYLVVNNDTLCKINFLIQKRRITSYLLPGSWLGGCGFKLTASSEVRAVANSCEVIPKRGDRLRQSSSSSSPSSFSSSPSRIVTTNNINNTRSYFLPCLQERYKGTRVSFSSSYSGLITIRVHRRKRYCIECHGDVMTSKLT